MLELDIRPVRGIGSLLQEYGIPGYFGDVDGDLQALAGEDGVHYWDVLVCEIAGDGEDEDSAVEKWGVGV